MLSSKHIIKNLTKFSFIRFCNSAARLSNNNEDLIVNINDKEEHFPLVWLRDNCKCNKCFHLDSKSRVINWNNFNIDVKVNSVEINKNEISVTWDDQHKSVYNFGWLKERSFSVENQNEFLNALYREEKVFWNKQDLLKKIKKYNFSSILENEEELFKYLRDLSIYGSALITNVPKNKTEGSKLIDKIGFARRTHYGKTFNVVAKPGTSNVAYLSDFLQLHTDLPYYDFLPGAIFLHCIKQTESNGGESLLADSFFVADKLRKENKSVFDLLSTVEVNWLDIGEEDGIKFHKMLRSPMICLDSRGNVEKVRHSVPQRDSHFTVDLKFVKPWYNALKVFIDLLNEHSCKFKVNEGEILAIDNRRIAHGRLGYNDTEENVRFIVGYYVDWDEIYSKLRVLNKES